MASDEQLHYYSNCFLLKAFNPASTIDKNSWISCYIKHILKINEFDSNFPKRNKLDIAIYFPAINITLQFNLAQKILSFKFYKGENTKNENLIWSHDKDDNYYYPCLESQISKTLPISEDDTKRILDGLIFHPAVHQHLGNVVKQKDQALLDPHEIRIGGGINNPFLFLFQIQYQFCLIEEIRTSERQRIIDLFIETINDKEKSIPPGKLFIQ